MVVTIPASYVTTLGPDVIEWIESNCVYPADRWLGQPFVLLPWQRRFINRLYACDDSAALRYRWALLGVPKKNGKTALAAALSLYHLFGDPDVDDPWAVCAASSDNQADLVFGSAKRIVELSPTLSRLATVFKSTITPRRGPGKLERVAAAKGKNDGKNISFLLLDELHEWNEQNWTVLTNGTAGRQRAQIVQITTAGWDLDTVCGVEYEKGRAIERGEVDNPTYLFDWYGAPDDADYSDPEVWRAANPSYGRLVTEEQLRDQYRNKPAHEFRRYFLNQWTRSASLWLPPTAWDACADAEGAALVDGEDTWIGWDASTKKDSTAVVSAQWEAGVWESSDPDDAAEATDPDTLADDLLLALRRTRGRLLVKSRIWECPRLGDGSLDPSWILPIAEVEDYVRSEARRYNVQEVAFDPAFVSWSAVTLKVEGLPMEEFWQTDARMCPGTAVTYELIINGRIAHDGDRLFARHIGQTATTSARNTGTRISKNKARAPMDASVALVMAAHRAAKALQARTEAAPTVW